MRDATATCFTVFLIALWSTSAIAQATPPNRSLNDTLLILDASGSMWGQIDGVNKIVIAKDVVEELTRGLPPQQRLGLVAYGHRTEGDCSDIQTLAGVDTDRETVIKAIRSISPKGKTPLSQSVEHAATALNYTRNAATVILVSDGLENCDVDPCKLARTLEENGLDFTVHVIGFDVTVQEREGLQCIAQETGGLFLAADNATELTDALYEVTLTDADTQDAQPSTPVPSSLALKATIMKGGPQILSQLAWAVRPAEGGDPVFQQSGVGAVETVILPGAYVVEASWSGWRDGTPKTGRAEFEVKPQQPRVITVPIDLELPVVLEAPDQVPEGVPIEIRWSGPDALNTSISVNRVDDAPLRKIYFFPTARARKADKTAADTDGDGDTDSDDLATALLGAPTIAGEYEIRYVINDPVVVLARRPLTVTDSEYTLTAPESAPVSTTIDITWTGPAEPGGVITLTEKASQKAMDNKRYVRAAAGEPARLTTPSAPGEYELRYVMSGGYTTYPGMARAVQTAVPIVVTDVAASVTGPATAVGGSTIQVSWQGPPEDWQDDFISIVEPGAEKFNRDSTARLVARSGETLNPAPIRVPAVEGDYEIVYGLQPGGRIIARQAIAIKRAIASVEVPETLPLGVDIPVNYAGDGFAGDRVVITPADTPDTKMWGVGVRYGFVARSGETQAIIRAAAVTRPGRYEVRYVTGLQHQVLARDTLTITE